MVSTSTAHEDHNVQSFWRWKQGEDYVWEMPNRQTTSLLFFGTGIKQWGSPFYSKTITVSITIKTKGKQTWEVSDGGQLAVSPVARRWKLNPFRSQQSASTRCLVCENPVVVGHGDLWDSWIMTANWFCWWWWIIRVFIRNEYEHYCR